MSVLARVLGFSAFGVMILTALLADQAMEHGYVPFIVLLIVLAVILFVISILLDAEVSDGN